MGSKPGPTTLARIPRVLGVLDSSGKRRGNRYASPRMRLRRIWLLLSLALALAGAGCGGFMARRLAQAPNTYPSWFAPPAPVALGFGSNYLAAFAPRFLEVGPPGARLRYRLIEPGDYRLQISSTNWLARGRSRFRFNFEATVPALPTRFTAAPRGTVVLLHSYGSDQTVMAPWALRLAQEGWRCVLVDLRGHGRSTGERIYFGAVETRDLSRLLDELAGADQLAEPVAAFGYSYGAALALRWEALDQRVRAAVALGPYAELASTILNVRHEYARFIPKCCIQAGLNRLPALLQVEPGELDPLAVLRRHPVTAFFVAGEEDHLTPSSDVKRLQQAAGSQSRFLLVPRATHEALPFFFKELADPVLSWLDDPHRQPPEHLP